jgi:hypothetical protein
MAIAHLYFQDNLPHGRKLRAALTQQENGYLELLEIMATMQLMIDGDGSQASQFGAVMTRFGFETLETAKAGWDELNSWKSKITTDGSVSFVNAAMLQVFNKFR